MTRNEMNIALSMVLTTAASIEDPMPLGPVYLVLVEKLGWGMSEYQILLSVLTAVGMAMVSDGGTILTLTPKGVEMAAKIDVLVAKAAAR